MTVRDLLKSSMRLIGVIGMGETPTFDEMDEALKSTNSMLGLWSVNGLLIFEIKQETFSFVAGQQSYTIGDGGDFDTVRPTKISLAGVIDSGIEYPINIINYQQWAIIPDKLTQSNLPTDMYVETSNPLARLFIYPVPSTANTLKLYSLKPLTAFASINDEVVLPPGYEELIKYNLAIRLGPEYGKVVEPTVERIAIESKLEIERMSSRELLLTSDLFSLVPRTYNIYSGQ